MRLGLGFEPLHARVRPRRAARAPRRVCSRAANVRGFGARAAALGFGQRGLRRLERSGRAPPSRARRCRWRRRPASILAISASSRVSALAVIARRRLELIAPRREIGERAGQFGEDFSDAGERRVGLGDALVDAGQLRGVAPALRPCSVASSAASRSSAAAASAASVRSRCDVRGELLEPAIEFGDALLGARFLAVERFARDDQPLQRRARPWLRPRAAPAARRRLGLPRGGLRSARRCASATTRTASSLARSASATSALAAIQRRWNSVASALRTWPEILR